MEVILVVAGTFLLCWLCDKGFTKLFRNKPQHKNGAQLRLNKHYATGGLLLCVLGCVSVMTGFSQGALLLIGGIILLLMGIALIVYYISFGIYYDEDSFVFSTFGKQTVTYYYRDIQAQQLYQVYNKTVIELHLRDGKAVQLHANMKGVYPFMDKAFYGWMRQKALKKEDCPFYDPDNSCWFPPVEG